MKKLLGKLHKSLKEADEKSEPLIPKIKSLSKRVKKNPRSELKYFVFKSDKYNKRNMLPTTIIISVLFGFFMHFSIATLNKSVEGSTLSMFNSVSYNSQHCKVSKDGQDCIDKIIIAEKIISDPERQELINSHKSKSSNNLDSFNYNNTEMILAVAGYDLQKKIELNPNDQELKDKHKSLMLSYKDLQEITNRAMYLLKLSLFCVTFLPAIIWFIWVANIRYANIKLNSKELEEYKEIEDLNNKKIKEERYELFGIEPEVSDI